MELLKTVTEGIKYIVKWVSMTYEGLCDWLGISEWSILCVALSVIAVITIPKILKQ